MTTKVDVTQDDVQPKAEPHPLAGLVADYRALKVEKAARYEEVIKPVDDKIDAARVQIEDAVKKYGKFKDGDGYARIDKGARRVSWDSTSLNDVLVDLHNLSAELTALRESAAARGESGRLKMDRSDLNEYIFSAAIVLAEITARLSSARSVAVGDPVLKVR